MNRLFSQKGKCLDVAIDHGFFNEGSFLAGIENMEQAIRTIVEAQPDAIQLTVGQAEILQDMPGKDKPALVLRTDVANCYNPDLPEYMFSQLIDDPVEQAVVLDAACVVVNLLRLPDQPELAHQCIENICALKPKCDRFGMPLMVEPLVMQPNEKKGGYMVDGDIHKILPPSWARISSKPTPATTSLSITVLSKLRVGLSCPVVGGERRSRKFYNELTIWFSKAPVASSMDATSCSMRSLCT